MKKIFLSLIFTIASLVACYSQQSTKSWWSVSGGVNFSNLNSPNYSTDFLTGFTVGASYNRVVSQTIPIYIEAGLYFEKSGARDRGFLIYEGGDSKFSCYQFKVPLLFGYVAPISEQWVLYPFAGLFYSVAVNGKFEIGSEEFDPYRNEPLQTLRDVEPSEQQLLHRSDLGVRVGMRVAYNSYTFGFAYDAGFTNLYTRELREQGYQAQSGSFTMQIGYIF